MSTWIHRFYKRNTKLVLRVTSLINNNDDGDSYLNNYHIVFTADCRKKCHKFCVFAAACTVSLSSIPGFALREIISVHLGILAQISHLHMGVLHAATNRGPVLLEDKSQGIQGRGRSGTGRKWRNTQLIISPTPLQNFTSDLLFQRWKKRQEAESGAGEKIKHIGERAI